MDAEQQRRQEFLDYYSVIFKRNAFLLIDKMVEMAQDTSQLVDEILHSIFFLGEISRPKISPREIFVNDDIFNLLKKTYPEPFTLYSSHLPRRSPFSCVLDMVVHLEGQEHEEIIKKTLQELVEKLMKDAPNKLLFSTTICISAASRDADAVRHYGVSVSTTTGPAGQILIATSCLNFWEKHVADAVMSYYPKKKKKTYFDRTIQLPAGVRCEAFNIRSRKAISPCLFCRNMFGLASDTQVLETPKWFYGNCAEAESLSNLLREEEVRQRVQRNGNWTEENQGRAKHDVEIHLRNKLRDLGFAMDSEVPVRCKFYTNRAG